MKLRTFCLCTFLALLAWPAAQLAGSGADKDKDADTRIKELSDKIKQQQKALADLETELKGIVQERTAERNKKDEIDRKNRFVKVEIRGKLIESVQRNVKPPVSTYAVVFDASQCSLDLGGNKELQSLAQKLKGSEVMVTGKKLPRPTASSPSQLPMMAPMMSPMMAPMNPVVMQMQPSVNNPLMMGLSMGPMIPMTPMMMSQMMMSPMNPQPIVLDVISVESLRPAQD